jgi:hypothetical protein
MEARSVGSLDKRRILRTITEAPGGWNLPGAFFELKHLAPFSGALSERKSKMASKPVKPISLEHRVKCAKLTPKALDGKKLCYFEHENRRDVYDMHVSGLQPDGSFILSVLITQPELAGPGNKPGKIHHKEVSLDQAIVDKIEKAVPCALLHGCDFVIFDNSPKARALCASTGQNSNRSVTE